MPVAWFAILSGMLAVYLLLDGFDLGVGAVYLWLGRTSEERSALLSAIGPFWDGNEVWLIAGGGVLFLAFPEVYASSMSGFYLPMTLALWLFLSRGLSLELRGHVDDRLWRGFWDAAFALSSTLLAVVLGAALGNVLRGVPLDPRGDFFIPFWTDWRTGPAPGALDWYTVLVGVLAAVTLALHGALFAAARTEGGLRSRARRLAFGLALAVGPLTAAALAATAIVRPASLDGFRHGPLGAIFFAVALGGWLAALFFVRRGADMWAFAGSCAFLAGLFASAAVGLYPYLLPSAGDPALGLTVAGAASTPSSLGWAMRWWIPGIVLAAAEFTWLYRVFRGRAITGYRQ